MTKPGAVVSESLHHTKVSSSYVSVVITMLSGFTTSKYSIYTSTDTDRVYIQMEITEGRVSVCVALLASCTVLAGGE